MRRCGGSRSSRNASRGTGTPPVRNSASASCAYSEPTPALEQRQHARHRIGHRHEVHAQVLRQRAHQRLDLLVEQARHQPLEGLLRQLVQHVQRDERRDAIVFVTRLESIAQLDHQRPGGEMVGKLLGIELGFAGRDVLLGEPQDLRILRLRPRDASARRPRPSRCLRELARRRTRTAGSRRRAGRRGAPSAAGTRCP